MHEEAIQCFDRALDLDPEDLDAQNNKKISSERVTGKREECPFCGNTALNRLYATERLKSKFTAEVSEHGAKIGTELSFEDQPEKIFHCECRACGRKYEDISNRDTIFLLNILKVLPQVITKMKRIFRTENITFGELIRCYRIAITRRKINIITSFTNKIRNVTHKTIVNVDFKGVRAAITCVEVRSVNGIDYLAEDIEKVG
jgi:hypothetical protein